LISAYNRGKVLGVIPKNVEDAVLSYAKLVGYTDVELSINSLWNYIEELIASAREYIPTPLGLASMAEYLPLARKFTDVVLSYRRVPEEWKPLWKQYINIRPLINDINGLRTATEHLYTHFWMKEDDFVKFLQTLKPYGYEDEEIKIIKRSADQTRVLRAFEQVFGTPRELTSMAEYSPTARKFALGQVEKMIDALPIEPSVKDTLKSMWKEFIRVRPVYDEVRRYITELLTDYQRGLMTKTDFVNELNQLKQWGVDEYEIQFYTWLAERRRARIV